ncbi:hypothetical protein E1262_18075 [Jiangella aurantiaca]|uniref:beta-N-acetylhexosaminidase n=1 Tax=Jiangella aurantiaca TaxID=2530373 RepID=A0A4R5A6J5_9ACTN|nr:family 20 glycosylhydrolase [Jiangella aurantiaca]TDD67738.1 hypothetical protein E1262_18075 [Jiangella aurantiaca]
MVPRPARLVLSAAVLGPLAGLLVSAAPAPAEPGNPAPVTVPAIRHWTGGAGSWELVPGSRIVVDPRDSRELHPLARLLADELAEQEGIPRPRIVSAPARPHDIRLDLDAGLAGDVGDEGYRLEVGETVTIAAGARDGAFYGTRTLLQALRTSDAAGMVARGTAVDWPTFADRGQMLDVGRKYFPVDYLKQQIRQQAWFKLNTFHLHLSDWNGFRVESELYPEIVSPQHYTKAELRDLEAYAATYGVTIVPEIDLPGHAAAISAARPDLAFQCETMSRPNNSWEGSDRGGWTLDYTKPATREFSRRLVAEVAAIFDSPYLHIGTDEVPLRPAQEACPELAAYQHERGYPYVGDVLVEYITELDEMVYAAGKTTQLWQWWDFQQPTSIDPPTRVVVNEWLSPPAGRVAQGYRTIGVQDGPLYVSPGFGAAPGSYGFFDVRTTYRDYPFWDIDGVLGYHVARWSDRTQQLPVGWVDYFARRPLAVVADRTWAAPGGDVRPFLDRFDRVGDANPVGTPDPADLASEIGANTGMLSQAGWTASASDEETAGEDGRAVNAVDNDPYTHWHSRYDTPLPHRLDVDLGAVQRIAGVRYMPRQDGGVNGKVRDFEVLVSADGSDWRTVASGTFAEDRTEFIVPFAATEARHVALRVLSEYGVSNRFAAVAEFDVVRAR